MSAAEQAFNRMSPQERTQFGQYIQQQAQQQGTPVPGFGQGVDLRFTKTRATLPHKQRSCISSSPACSVNS